MAAPSYTDLTLYRRLLTQARPFWAHVGLLFLLNLASTPIAVLTPLPLKIAVDSVLGSRPLPGLLDALIPLAIKQSESALLLLAAGLVIAISLLNQLQDLATSVLRVYTGEKLVLGFRTQLFRHIQRLSLAYHDTLGTSHSAYRIQYDAPAIQYIAIDGVIPFIGATVTLGMMLYIILQLDVQLALIAVAISPALFVVARANRRHVRSHWRRVKDLESSAQAVMQEVLAALPVVKAFGQEDREEARFLRHSAAGVRARVRVAFLEGSFGILLSVATMLGTASVLFIGIRHVQAGALTLGELLLIMGYLTQLYTPLKTMSQRVASVQSALASAERTFALLDEAPDVVERPGARPLVRAAGAVAFRQVSFAYASDMLVLRDLSFEVGPGTRLGIAGTTGAGKTTLVNLLTRFYDPSHGQILLDGVDLRDFRLADLRNQFAVVLQEPVLFSTSIAENIAYARPSASQDEIVAAAKAASAHDFIMGLPRGYESQVGERGLRLSGGERQRISLARAFLKDARILILDEPTSSVDLKTENAIMEAMLRLMRGRTSFLIAHRLSTLECCDTRLQIENGGIGSFVRVGHPDLDHEPVGPPEIARTIMTAPG
jgi:ATP-binding cassette subfamily B protein